MNKHRQTRNIVLTVVLLLSALWAFTSAAQKGDSYPNDEIITDAAWLHRHLQDQDLVVVDVRTDQFFDGSLIPGAVRMPWSLFRLNDIGNNLASRFIGVQYAQEILGRHGITRTDTVVLYDSIERDGGATAAYVFWILDILGHEKVMILEQGIDGWKHAGFDLVTKQADPSPLFYQAGSESIRKDLLIDGNFVYARLGDPYYQIIDVRSRAEYVGQKGTKGLDGNPLKLGHIPTAVNINYTAAWTDPETKRLKPYAELRHLYKGLDPSRATIVYCNSGRRSAFTYFILRLMGIDNVITYEPSWKEWGNPENYYPVEMQENILTGQNLPALSADNSKAAKPKANQGNAASAGEPSGGYVSCGG